MEPHPDHGETSYVGSGRLRGHRALITGGNSGMGRAAAVAFARERADVAINFLSEEEFDTREVIDLIRREGGKAATRRIVRDGGRSTILTRGSKSPNG